MKIDDIEINVEIDKKHLVKSIKEYVDSQLYKDEIFIYRGQSKKKKWFYTVPKDGIRETPRDTNLKVHNRVNAISQELMGGYKLRNGIFCTQDNDLAFSYGELHIIIPTNNTVFYISEFVGDFTGHMESDAVSEYGFKSYLDNLGLDIDELGHSESNKLYDNYIDDVLYDYVNSMEGLTMNDHMNESDNEIVAFGDMYIIPFEVATKLINKIKGA